MNRQIEDEDELQEEEEEEERNFPSHRAHHPISPALNAAMSRGEPASFAS